MKTTELTKDEVVATDVQFNDVILIQTLNSLYRFSVARAGFYGRLIGGIFRECAVEAAICAPSLRVGSAVRLLISSGSKSKLMTTSTIKSLTHIRAQLHLRPHSAP